MEDIFVPIAIFYLLYRSLKELLDFFLKRRIINSGHIEKAGILDSPKLFSENTETQKYPSLKWGLVFFFTGVGTIISSYMFYQYYEMGNYKARHFAEMFSVGIILASISLGFLIYFLIVMRSKK